MPELTQAVYDHTYFVCRALVNQGTPAAIVQVGNEINSGILFPDGSDWNPPNWANLAGFLEAGAKAVKDADPDTKVMLHLANGWDNGTFEWFFDNITALGVPFDVIGASFYDYWGGSLGDLQANLDAVSARYDKDVLVAETAYPFTLDEGDSYPNAIGLPSQLVAGYLRRRRPGSSRICATCCRSSEPSPTAAASAPSTGTPPGRPSRATGGIRPIRRRGTTGRTRRCSTSATELSPR